MFDETTTQEGATAWVAGTWRTKPEHICWAGGTEYLKARGASRGGVMVLLTTRATTLVDVLPGTCTTIGSGGSWTAGTTVVFGMNLAIG